MSLKRLIKIVIFIIFDAEEKSSQENRMEKIGSKLLLVLFALITCLSGVLAGTQIEQKRIEAEAQLDTTSEIAVVNLDEGIKQDNKQVYYSNELMEYPNENFVMTNLEFAKLGINNGSFAAYVIIPSDFSKNAASINGEPKKVILEYALNQNLRQDFAVLAIADIKNFEIQINTNMSYMYMQAILDEFHNVQDSADIIMKNDVADMEKLTGIDAEGLVDELEFIELEQVDAELGEINLDDELLLNVEYAEQLRDNYDEFVTTGMEEFEAIKESEGQLVTLIDEFSLSMTEIDIMSNEDGTLVYEEGLESIETYIDEYEMNHEEYVGNIMKKLGVEGPIPTITPTPIVPTPTITPTPIMTPIPTVTPSLTITPTPTSLPDSDGLANSNGASVQKKNFLKRNYKGGDVIEDIITVKNLSVGEKPLVRIPCLESSLVPTQKSEKIVEPTQEPEGTVEATQEPEEIAEATQKPKETAEATQEPEETAEPTQEPEGTVEATQEPEGTANPTQEPGETADPTQESEETTEPTQEPDKTSQPTQTPEKVTTYTLMREGGNTAITPTVSPTSSPTSTPTITPTIAPTSTPTPADDEALLSVQIKKAIEEELQKQLKEYNKNLEDSITILEDEIAGLSADQQEEFEKIIDEIQQVNAEKLLADLDMDMLMEEVFKELIADIQNAPSLDVEEIRLMIEDEISMPIQERLEEETERIGGEAEIVNQGLDDYILEQSEFDPYNYLDQEKIDTLLAEFEDNVYLIEDEINQFYYDNLDYADAVLQTADNNILTLRENLETAYTGTKENVLETVNDAKESRKSINEINIDILEDFTKKLPYTRIGELEYVQAYDFMVKPVVSVDTGNGKVSMIIAESDYEILKQIIVILVGAWCLCALGLLAYKLKHAEKNDL